jgi:phage tail-like protein
MSFNNKEYLLQHLPARLRRDDAGAFLYRFLQWFGQELDAIDETFDTFWERLNPDTAPEEWVEYWLSALFGWSWFPAWLPLERKRQLYANMARHLARRGTKRGIEGFLAAFGLPAEVINGPLVWGERIWGANDVSIGGPLGLLVRLFPPFPGVTEDLGFWGESVKGESYWAHPSQQMTRAELEELVRWGWPLGNVIMLQIMQPASPFTSRRRPPSPAFSLSRWSPGDSLIYEFDPRVEADATAATSPNGALELYEWDWGDGSPATYGVKARHIYQASGFYLLRLTVVDSAHRDATARQIVQVLI